MSNITMIPLNLSDGDWPSALCELARICSERAWSYGIAQDKNEYVVLVTDSRRMVVVESRGLDLDDALIISIYKCKAAGIRKIAQ